MFRFSEDPKLSPVASKLNVLLPSPDTIVIPPPLAAASLAAPVPNSRFLSSTVIVVELTVVVVPSTWKSPAITTLPVLSPTPAGSRVIVAGPEIVSDVTLIADPSAPVWNAEAVTVLEAFTVPVIPNCDPLNVKLPESSTSPPVPAIRTRLSVRSSTTNVLAVTPPLKSAAVPTVRVEPSNVRFPLSSSAPPVPATTIRLSVRSETVAELSVVSPPAMFAPPSASIAPLISTVPVNVETPDTLS